jgi:4-carboxymuconolactone decarboxylase
VARVPQATRDGFPEELKYVWDALATDGEPPNIFKALGVNPALLRAYLRLGNGLWANCGLDLPTREMVILRSAFNKQSKYEWHQHVRIGRDAGLTNDQINALRNPQRSSLFSEKEKVLLDYADAMARDNPPSEQQFRAMVEAWGEQTAVGVTMLVPFYEMTAKCLAALDVETEETFVGWTV